MRRIVCFLLYGILCSCSLVEVCPPDQTNCDDSRPTLETKTISGVVQYDDQNYGVCLSEAKNVAIKYSSGRNLQDIYPYVEGRDTLFFVANYEKGYKLISADKRYSPFLVESEDGHYKIDEDGESLGPSIWVDCLAHDILQLKRGEAEVTNYSNLLFWRAASGEIDLLGMDQLSTRSFVDSIDYNDEDHTWVQYPVYLAESDEDLIITDNLLSTKWGQDDPWSDFVPYTDTDQSSHCPTGCAAVAMAQILYFCHYNLGKPNGLHHGAFTSGIYGAPSAPMTYHPGTYVSNSDRWDDMAVDLYHYYVGGNANYVGQFMAEVGHEIGMSYTPSGSGASLSVHKFRQFGIDCDHSAYSSSTVVSCLSYIGPVAVTAFRDDNGVRKGHAWVIDGLVKKVHYYTTYYEWRRLSEVPPGTYPLYTESEARSLEPDLYSGKEIRVTTGTYSYSYKMNWGYDGVGDDALYGANSSWIIFGNRNYQYDREIWYHFR